MLYVKIDEKNKPYLSDWSNEPKDGYKQVPGLMDNQIVAVIKFTDKCFLDENGALVAPNQLPISEQEKQAALQENKLKTLTDELELIKQTNSDLAKKLEDKETASEKQQQLINYLTIKLNSLGAANDGGGK